MDDAGNTADHLVDAGVVILSAGTIETPNIALRSPGLLGAGREDLFGRFVTVHVYPGAVGWFDERVNWQLGVWSTRCLDDWYWPDLRDPAVSFIKGGNVQNIGRTAGYPLSGPVGTAKMGPWGSPGFQARLPEDRRDMGDLQRNFMEYFNDHLVVLGMVGEALPRYGNRVDQDPSIRDPFGSPAPRITYDYHPMDIAMTEFYTPRLAGLLEAAGAYATAGLSSTIEGQPPGGVHVHGSMRMGEGPGAEDWSVTDRWGKIRGVEGVYVADASLFTSSLGYNPALTVQALSWRTAEHLVRAGGA
jgi:choline dehydrogenase-like flavoprotein